MSRLPIRLRVACAFALAMALVLTAAGVTVYKRLASDLQVALDQDLRLRADDLTALAQDKDDSLATIGSAKLVERGESFAQVLGRYGRVVAATPTLGVRPLIGGADLAKAMRRPTFVNIPSAPGLDEPARLLATPVVRAGHRMVLVVGATRENRAEALRDLRTELLIAGPLALILASVAGYLLAGTSLRAVEAMRSRAAAVSGERVGERLPVPRTGDELERLGNTLNEMLERLEGALARERVFVAEAGHELRTPLALLRAELDFALQHADSDVELRDAVREASAETDRLVQLAADLLLIAGADDGRLALRCERLSVADVLASVQNRFAWRAGEAGRRLEIEASAELTLWADRLRVEQALGNLVENALRYGDGTVRLAALARDDMVELHVRDAGEGIPPAFLPAAFERFSRADEGRTSGGAGLGLAIVRAIAAAHDGSARAANLPGGGADVWLELPAGGPDTAPGSTVNGAGAG